MRILLDSNPAVQAATPIPVVIDDDMTEPNSALEDASAVAEPTRSTDEWMALLYQDLRKLAYARMPKQRANHTLQPTALLHEAYAHMKRRRGPIANRAHFYHKAARAMHDVLVEYARRRAAQRRGGHLQRVTCTTSVRDERQAMTIEEVLGLSRALDKMTEKDPLAAQMVLLRYFGGLTVLEVAQTVGLPKRTVERKLRAARAWLNGRLQPRKHGKRD